MSDAIDRAAEVIGNHVGKPAHGGTANGAWVDCACLAEAKGVSRDHATRLHRKHVARALDAAGLLVTPEHGRAVAARALREAAAFVDEYAYEPSDAEKPPSGQERGFYLGATEAHRVVYRLLNERADRIEAGEADADA